MTSTITPEQVQKALSYLQQETVAAVQKELAARVGAATVRLEQTKEIDPKAELLCFRQAFQPSDFGYMSFAVARDNALSLGKNLSGAEGAAGADVQAAEEALWELFAKLGGSLASRFSGRAKRRIEAQALSAQAAIEGRDQSFTIRISVEGGFADVIACASAALLEALITEDAESQSCMSIAVPPQSGKARNLDVLLEVEMPVSVSFGKAQLMLRDVFKLSVGSVVELNRLVSEPVDIVVNNSVIARGEVVVVEGNFGVRITHVISKQDRLRSLT